jgi:hypothetical protein
MDRTTEVGTKFLRKAEFIFNIVRQGLRKVLNKNWLGNIFILNRYKFVLCEEDRYFLAL